MINKFKQIILFSYFAVPKFVDKVRKKEGQGRIKEIKLIAGADKKKR